MASAAWLVPVSLYYLCFYNPFQICGVYSGATRLAWSTRCDVTSELYIPFVHTVTLLVLLLKLCGNSRAGLRTRRFVNRWRKNGRRSCLRKSNSTVRSTSVQYKMKSSRLFAAGGPPPAPHAGPRCAACTCSTVSSRWCFFFTLVPCVGILIEFYMRRNERRSFARWTVPSSRHRV
jgi:hypothetical protein